MGLFDVWSDSPGSQADLALAAGLLAGKGSFGGILGRSLAGGQESYNQASEIAQRKKLQDLQAQMQQQQLATSQQQQMDADSVRKFWGNQANYMQPARQATGDYGPGEAPQLPAGPMSPRGVAQSMLASGSPALAQQGFAGLQKSYTPMQVKQGETLGSFDPDTGKFNPAYTAPKEQAPSQLSELIAERNKYPPTHPMFKVYSDAIEKASTHQPPIVQMGLGSPVAVTGPDGKQVLVQPPTKPGGKAEIVQINGQPVTPTKNQQSVNPGQAAQMAMMEQGVKNIDDFSSKIFVATGDPTNPTRLNRTLLTNVNLPYASIGGEARESRTAIRNAIEARLRLESGAAVPETEVNRAMSRFMPNMLDDVSSAQYKLNQLRQFFTGALSMTKAGNPDAQAGQAAPTGSKVIQWKDLP